jgi:hypothetical protein
VANVLELRTDGLGEFTFGDPMTTVFLGLVELLGEPVIDDRMHGDLPLGFGGEDSTARVVDFGGLRVVFGDWPTPYRDDRVMHVLAWGAGARRSESGTRLVSRRRGRDRGDGHRPRDRVRPRPRASARLVRRSGLVLRGTHGGGRPAHRKPRRASVQRAGHAVVLGDLRGAGRLVRRG